jgi:hypothetical protein
MRGGVPLHCACGTDFFHLASLCAHVSVSLECFEFWGGSISKLKKKVVSHRNAWNYDKTKEKRALHYANNPEPQKQAYQKKKKEKDLISLVALREFERAGRYGPVFACVSCHETNWKSNVHPMKDLTNIRDEYIDMEYVTVKHRKLFFKINSFYLCQTCKQAINASRMPRRCARNMLLCPWENVEGKFLSLNEVCVLVIDNACMTVSHYHFRLRTLS